ncbi:transposase [Ancylomarina longa]|uniref:transposase n=1 Tax=Ancylomarina longa TaxID=2487017 RepID=UPI001ADEA08E|nr:transposase [Ancylomarina longa]
MLLFKNRIKALICTIFNSNSFIIQEKKIGITLYVDEYERNNKRVRSKLGRYMKGKRQSTVEPVFGTLTQFMGLRKINTIGIRQANKVMLMSACAYNLKKLLKFVSKNTETMVNEAIVYFSTAMNSFGSFNSFLSVQ